MCSAPEYSWAKIKGALDYLVPTVLRGNAYDARSLSAFPRRTVGMSEGARFEVRLPGVQRALVMSSEARDLLPGNVYLPRKGSDFNDFGNKRSLHRLGSVGMTVRA